MVFPEGKNIRIASEAFAACAAGDFGLLKELVRGSFNLEDCDEEGNSALHYAVRGGNMEIIRFLTEQGGLDPTWANLHMETPVQLAARICPEAYAYFTARLGYTLAESYQNPVRRGMHPDPSIVRVGEDYYMVNSSFIMFPCIPISHSRDLVHWTVIGYAVTDADWAAEHLDPIQGGRGFWAPDISYYNGRFYICATLRMNDDAPYIQMQMVTSAEKPEGPYNTPVLLKMRGIDPSIFTDDDGKRYMLVNRGAQIAELSEDGTKLLSEQRLIWYGSNKHAPEGPHILKKDGWYYCFLAEGGTGMGHMITVARSKKLYGPYEDCPYNPIMRQKHSAGVIQCAGHGKPVSTPDGRWFMVYLCSRFLEGKWGMLGRETCLDEITWTPDGWPLVNGGKGPSTLAKLPFADAARGESAETAASYADARTRLQEMHESDAQAAENTMRFQDTEAEEAAAAADAEICPEQEHDTQEEPNITPYKGWYTPRTFDTKHLHMPDENGMIKVKGCGEDLCSLACRSVLLRNQPDFDFDFAFEMYGTPQTGDAGVTLYYDENTYVKFGRTADEVFISEYYDDRYVREERFKIAKLKQEARAEAADAAFLQMLAAGENDAQMDAAAQTGGEAVCADEEQAFFAVKTRGVVRSFWYNNIMLAEWRVTGICSEGLVKGKRFTSAMYGVYVNGEGVLRWRQHGNLQQNQ